MANPHGQGFEDLRNTLGETARIVRRRWHLALVGLTMIGSVAFWYSQYLPREYTAATLFERRDDAVLQNLISANSPYGFDHLKSTLTLDMLGSRALANAAARVGLLPSGMEDGAGALTEAEREALDAALHRYEVRPAVSLLHSSAALDTILLQCSANDPVRAREFVVALRDNYIADTRERMRGILNSTKTFFESELSRFQTQADEADGALRTGFEDYPGLDPTDLVSVGGRLELLRTQRDEAHQRRAELEAQIAAREEFLTTAPALFAERVGPDASATGPVVTAKGLVDPAIDRGIDSVRSQMLELVTGRRMTMEHPEVRMLLSRLEALEDLRKMLAAAQPDPEAEDADPVPSSMSTVQREWQAQQMRVELELDSLRRQLDASNRQWTDATERFDRFHGLYEQLVGRGDQLRQLREQRTEATAEATLWQGHLTRLERVLTAESGERGTQFALIEEPKDDSVPTKPRIAAVFAVCPGLGLAAAALLVAIAELLDRSIRSPGQVVRTLGLPVLECVGVIPTPRERRRRRWARLAWTPVLAGLVCSLFLTAMLAYASLALPGFHQRTMRTVDTVLDTTGITWLFSAGGRML